MAIQFKLTDRDTATAERLWTNKGVGSISIVMDGKIYSGGSVIDAKTGALILSKDDKKAGYRMTYYNGNIYAGGLFIGNDDPAPHSNPRKRTSEEAHFTSYTYEMGKFGKQGKQNVLNLMQILSLVKTISVASSR